MKELLVQNFLKKYMNRIEPSAAAGNNGLIARIVANEVDLFMEKERGQSMNQKALKVLEKDIEIMIRSD